MSEPKLLKCCICASMFCAGVIFSIMVSHANDNKQQLNKLQQNIVKKEKSIQQQQQYRTILLSKLKQQEQSLYYSTMAWRKTKKTLNRLNHDIDYLNSSISKLQRNQAIQYKLLGQQLDMVFRQRQYAGLQWVFSNHVERQRRERILAYFVYLNKDRENNIKNIRQTCTKLTVHQKKQQQKQHQQHALLQQQKKQQGTLQNIYYTYHNKLTSLNYSLMKNQKNIMKLRNNKKRLRDTIAHVKHAAQVKQQIQTKHKQATSKRNLGLLARQVMWPVRGHKLLHLHSFGEQQQGDLRYKGLVIAAPEGSLVQAIAHGRVMMADWLQGYGLMVVIEHGKNYMSLYGYNQSTLVHVGDQVKAGQAIALVGSNGGIPSLYFEIRRQGQAVNPTLWLGRSFV